MGRVELVDITKAKREAGLDRSGGADKGVALVDITKAKRRPLSSMER